MRVVWETEVDASACPQIAEDAPYQLQCVLPRGHDGECHAHWFGEDGACSCGMRDEEETE